ncbi:hypothetical protein Tco_1024077 [Tanacetum coccineum]
MLTEEMNLTNHYQMYISFFGVDVPMNQSQPIESTHKTRRTPSAPRPPNPVVTQGESSAPRKLIIIRIPRRRQPDPETPIPTTAKIDTDNFNEATRLSITTARSLEDLEAQHNVEKVQENMVDEEIEKIELRISETTPSSSKPSSSSLKPKPDALKSMLKKVAPPMVNKRVNEIAKLTVPLYVAEGLLLNRQKTQIEIDTLIAEAGNKE